MRKLVVIAVAILAAVATLTASTPTVEAQPQDQTVPYWLEPAPICGSDLAIVEGGACTPTSLAPVFVGARACPALSAGRFAGASYDYTADPLGVVTYASVQTSPARQAEDDARTWDRYCAIPLNIPGGGTTTPTPTATPTPAPAATPEPTATPAAPLIACPVGTTFDGLDATTGRVRCVATSSTTSAAVPVFTG